MVPIGIWVSFSLGVAYNHWTEYTYTTVRINILHNVLVNICLQSSPCSSFTLLKFSPFGDATFGVPMPLLCLCYSMRLSTNFQVAFWTCLKSWTGCFSETNDVSSWGSNANSTQVSQPIKNLKPRISANTTVTSKKIRICNKWIFFCSN